MMRGFRSGEAWECELAERRRLHAERLLMRPLGCRSMLRFSPSAQEAEEASNAAR